MRSFSLDPVHPKPLVRYRDVAKTNQRRCFKTVFSIEAISDFAWVITSDTLPEK